MYSINSYVVTGGEDTYNISFSGDEPGYLAEEHVHYFIDNILQDDSSRTFITSTSIQINPIPIDGTAISFKRITSPETPLVDWLAGGSVTEENLDINTLQMLYIAQESSDNSDITVTEEVIIAYLEDSTEGIFDELLDEVAASDVFENYLAKDNTVPYTPTLEYHPATLKTVDDKVAGLVIDEAVFGNYLAKDNTTPYTPTLDYHPATIKAVDTKLIDFTPTTDSMLKADYDFNTSGVVDAAESLTGTQAAAITANTIHTLSTSNPHYTNKTTVGLGNVTDDLQIKASQLVQTVSTATDVIPSSGAIKTYVDTLSTVMTYNALDNSITNNNVDTSVAFQTLIDTVQATPLGGTIWLPNGTYSFSKAITNDRSAGGSQVSIVGESKFGVRINYTGSGNWYEVTGDRVTLEGTTSYQTVSNMTIVGKGAGASTAFSTALVLIASSFFYIKDVYISGWDYGIRTQDVDQAVWNNLEIRFCNQGMWGTASTALPAATQANNWNFYGCTIGNCTYWGLTVTSGSHLNFYGGDIEANGSDAFGWAVKVENAGYQGGIGANFHGTYFENNMGVADIILLSQATNPGVVEIGNDAVHNVSACSFKRMIAPGRNTVNHIRCEFSASGGHNRLVTNGNSHRQYGTGYTPSAGTLYIQYTDTPGVNGENYFDLGSYFGDAVETPAFTEGTGTAIPDHVTGDLTVDGNIIVGGRVDGVTVLELSDSVYANSEAVVNSAGDIDDLEALLNQSVKTTASPSFANVSSSTYNLNTVGNSVASIAPLVTANTTHRTSSGTNHSNVVLNNTHRTSSGSNHSYINQSVTTTANVNFTSVTIGSSGALRGSTGGPVQARNGSNIMTFTADASNAYIYVDGTRWCTIPKN